VSTTIQAQLYLQPTFNFFYIELKWTLATKVIILLLAMLLQPSRSSTGKRLADGVSQISLLNEVLMGALHHKLLFWEDDPPDGGSRPMTAGDLCVLAMHR